MKKSVSFICATFILLSSLAVIGISVASEFEEDSEDRIFVNLKAARFDPLQEKPNIPPNLMYPADNDYYLVQCKGPIQHEWIQDILDSNAVILGYIPEYTYILHMEEDTKIFIESLSFVRWVGIYHPAYKIQEDLLLKHGPVQLNIMVFRNGNALENLNLVKDSIMNLGGSIIKEEDVYVVIAEIDASHIRDIAFIPEVEWMDKYSPPRALMDNIRVFTGAESPLHEYGFSGTGIVGEVKDAGIYQDHPEFEGQILATDGNVDEDSHGTSTFGIVFAKGVQDRAKGMMPGAQGVFCDWGVGRKQSIANLVNNWGGVFQSNSWSSGASDSSYSSISQQNDDAIFEYDVTMLYASGNGGDDGAVTQEATAKNVIAVGAFSHYDNTNRSDDAHTGSQGNKGPVDDGRIKPDVVGPYDYIYTTSSSEGYTSTFGGTSGATPVAAGAVGLVYEMYRDNHFGNNPAGTMPHAATVKAILIADAYQYEFSQGDRFAQGWGLVDVGNVYNIGEKHLIDDENNALKTGDSIIYKITPISSTPLKISLVWTDVPGTTSSSMHLINDLGLRVYDPNGVLYHGNWMLDGGKWSFSGGQSDHINNVENVFIEDPMAGEWTIEVVGENIPLDGVIETASVDQSYALVASNVVKDEHDLKVQAVSLPRSVDVGQNIQIKTTIMNIGTNYEVNVKVWLLVDNNTVDSTFISSIGVGETEETSFDWIPTAAKEYYISLYVEPQSGEISLGDNWKHEVIDASYVSGRILVDDGHGTEWRHHIYYHYIENLEPGNFRVSHTDSPITSELLSNYDVFITAWPTESYTSEEITSIQSFVETGGGLLVMGKDEQNICADLTDYAGIDWGTPYLILFSGDTSEINQHEITENVNSLHFGSHELPLEASFPAEEIAYTFDGMIYSRVALAVSEYGFGKVVAIADEELLNSEFIHDNDNKILGENIIRWLIDTGPIPIIDSPANGGTYDLGDSIFFDGSSSYDPDGDELNYLWSSNISGEIGNTVSFSTTLEVGQHTITLEVSDDSDNNETAEITLSVQSPPSVFIQSPIQGSLLGGIIEVSGTSSDIDGIVSTVEIKLGEDEWAEATDTSGSENWSSWSIDWDTINDPDGTYTISSRSRDNAGLNSDIHDIIVTLDNTPPLITLGPEVTSKTDKTATIEWETDEPSQGIIEYREDGSGNIETEMDGSFDIHHVITLSDLSHSTRYLFLLEVNDKVGNSYRTEKDREFTTDQPPDTTPPNAYITEPNEGAELKDDVIVEVSANDDSGIDKVEFYINDKLKSTDDSFPYTWLWITTDGHYPDDEYTIKIVAIDMNGNEKSDEISVTLDNEIIVPQVIKKNANPNTINSGESTKVLFTVTVSDPESHIESITIDLSSIDRSSNQIMYDDGSHGDEEADDDVYSYRVTVPIDTDSGEFNIPVTVTYTDSGRIDSSITLYILPSEEEEPSGTGSSKDDENQDFLWFLMMVILILVVFAISAAILSRNKKRPKNQFTVAPSYPQQYYPEQTDYYQQDYFR
jgi:hypothetical protein